MAFFFSSSTAVATSACYWSSLCTEVDKGKKQRASKGVDGGSRKITTKKQRRRRKLGKQKKQRKE
ncbi:hypothetical protein MGYG_09003 [Nannizzia gypsea CBS 118893]|uniref:Uncharacterized protein n=1 Tax=Arthroderma gypseum (strain ATCC MYA-4604 / CBS 118893) TaxID=535722 RepID=E4UPU7_ARTGP|nr:hypothetical protein MGYG_09003 [Nannizzia gypsea CBS 118893]EFQ99919.1 hypothetical protein MGYG_09003 [Nannizzia gypsea CBS 118893]